MSQIICFNFPMITASEMYDKYLTAEAAILTGQTVRFGERWLTYADLGMVQAGRKEWEQKAAAETRVSSGGTSPRYQLPDFSA